jgi:hypothetical protein
MSKISLIKSPLFLVATLFLTIFLATALGQPPERPMLIYGSITVNGNPVPDGLTVWACVDGLVGGRSLTSGSTYELIVQGANGQTVRFYIQNELINQSIVFDNITGGGVLYLNLTVTDNTPPSSPLNLRLISITSHGQVTYGWDAATDNLAVAGYYVRLDSGDELWVGNVTSWTSPSSLGAGVHELTVTALDVGNNRGPPASLNQSFPGSVILTVTPQTLDMSTGQSFTIVVNISPNIPDQIVVVFVKNDTGDWVEIARGPTDQSGRFMTQWTPPRLGTYRFMAGWAWVGVPSSFSEPVEVWAIPEFITPSLALLTAAAIALVIVATNSKRSSLQ